MKNALAASTFIASILIFSACREEPKNCRFGKPKPIFSNDLPRVKAHEFEGKTTTSEERVAFDTGLELEIVQSGCETIRQEFRFFTAGDYRTFADSVWMKEAVRQLVFLSSLSPKQAQLRPWADAIEESRHSMKLGEEKALQPGILAKIDRVVGADRATLVLVLSQE